MKIIYETRFSFLGQSGWQSRVAGDAGLLFAPERLERRFALFERVTLPSLAAQTDPEFEVMVLASAAMPAHWQARLRTLLHDVLGEARTHPIFARPGFTGRIFRRHILRRHGGEARVAQVVLDDDDALAADFTALCRAEAVHMAAQPPEDTDYGFISFPRGLSLIFEGSEATGLAPRNVAFTNLGLTLVAPPGHRKTPFGTAHRKIGARHPARVVHARRPFYLRAVHDTNDSRAHLEETRLSAEETRRVTAHFPFLPALLPGAAGLPGAAAGTKAGAG